MGLGLSGAYGAVGAQNALRDMETRAIEAKLREQAAAQEQFRNSIALRQIVEQEATGSVTRENISSLIPIRNAAEGRAATEFGWQGDDRAQSAQAMQTLKGLNPVAVAAKRGGFSSEEPFLTDDQRMQRAVSGGQRQGAAGLAAFQSGGRDVLNQTEGPNGLRTLSDLRLIGARNAGDLALARERGALGDSGQQSLVNLARQAAENPELLDKMTPTDRTDVMAMIANSGELRTVGQNTARRQMEETLAAIADLRATAGKSGAIGAPSVFEPGSLPRLFGASPLAGSNAAGYTAKLDQVKARLTMPRMQMLRGLGPMSDRDLAMLERSASALGSQTGEAFYDKELANIEQIFKDAIVRAGGTSAGAGSGSVRVTGRDGKTYEFPTQAAADAFKKAGG